MRQSTRVTLLGLEQVEGGKRLGLEVQTEDIEHTPQKQSTRERVHFESVTKTTWAQKQQDHDGPSQIGSFLPLASPLCSCQSQRGQKQQVVNTAEGQERRHKTGKEKADCAAFPTAGF